MVYRIILLNNRSQNIQEINNKFNEDVTVIQDEINEVKNKNDKDINKIKVELTTPPFN